MLKEDQIISLEKKPMTNLNLYLTNKDHNIFLQKEYIHLYVDIVV